MKRAVLIGTIMILLVPQLSWGQIPQTMSYQGVVTDAIGMVVNGDVNLTFRLWDAVTAGTLVWEETQNGIPVSNGIFNVILGNDNPLNIPFDKQYWLGVTVGTDPELTPRVQLTSSPYSLSTQSSSSGLIIIIWWDGSQEKFGTLDPATGVESTLGTVGDLYIWQGNSAIDGNLLYVEGENVSGTKKVYTLDITTGQLVSEVTIAEFRNWAGVWK